MSSSFDAERFSKALESHLFGSNGARDRFVSMIINAGLYRNMLRVSTFESIRYHPDPGFPRPVKHPEFERLVLVIPESFEATWEIAFSGHFLVSYRKLSIPLPHRVNPFNVSFSAVMIAVDNELLFRNERVRLVGKR